MRKKFRRVPLLQLQVQHKDTKIFSHFTTSTFGKAHPSFDSEKNKKWQDTKSRPPRSFLPSECRSTDLCLVLQHRKSVEGVFCVWNFHFFLLTPLIMQLPPIPIIDKKLIQKAAHLQCSRRYISRR